MYQEQWDTSNEFEYAVNADEKPVQPRNEFVYAVTLFILGIVLLPVMVLMVYKFGSSEDPRVKMIARLGWYYVFFIVMAVSCGWCWLPGIISEIIRHVNKKNK